MIAALAVTAALVLHGGQTRWLLPSQVRTGEPVRCIDSGGRVDVKMPAVRSGLTFDWAKGGAKVQIQRRPNGATVVLCGDATLMFPPPNTAPYVISQNGVDFIRGANRYARLVRIYGRPSSRRSCRAIWRSIGLEVAFERPACDVLAGATVTGPWGSLSGVRVGDPLAEMVWTVQSAKRISKTRWLIGSGAQYRSRLYAIIGGRQTVAGFTATLRRPPH